MNLLSRSLVWRLVFSMFVLSVIATTIAAGLAYLRARDALSQSILERLTLAATLKENELKRIIGEKKTSMQFLASLPEFRMYASKLHGTSRTQMSRSRAALRKILAEPMVQDLGFREILILEAQSGLVLFSTDAAHQNDYRTLDRFFIEGSKGIFVHNVHPWPVTFQPTMTIALPLLTLHGDSIGVLAAHINLDLLDDILFEHSGLGMTGETYLVDRYNVFVSSKRFERKEYVRGVHTPGIDAAVRGTDSSGLYQNYAGVPIVGVFRWLDDFEIALIAEIHQSEAFEPARRLAMSVVSSGMLLAVALAIGIYLLSLQIVRPILAIKESAVRATEGDLSVMAPVEMQDEVGILARAFNAMIGNLRTTLASLRQELKERQVVEDALRQSEIRWQFALEGAGDGVWDWDVRTNRVFFSHRWKEMLGYTDDEIDGTVDAWESRLHPDDRERVHQELNTHFKHPNSTYVSEHRLRCKDGSYKWVLDRGKVMLREIDGTPLRMLGTHTDITETKAAEQQLKESEEAFRTIFAASPLGVSLIDAQEQYVDVNDAFLEMHGVDRDKVIGKGVFEAGLLEEGSERGDLILSVQRAGGVLSSDVRFIRRDGERHEGLMIVKIITLHGRMYALGFLLDVSGQKRAEREKLEMERRVLHAQKLESLGVLAGGVAHDFNNLLMAMLGNLNIAMQKLPASNPVYMNITRAEQAVHRASELTRQMLAYSGKGKFIIKQISLTELVQECSALLRMSVAHTISFEQHLADNLPFIKADPGQVEQVVMNLITNASEAIGTSPGVITLTTGVKEYTAEQLSQSRLDVKASPGVYVWLETTDTGCGMGEETQKRLFEPFFTTKFTGRGLGMSAVLGILRGHQGAIFVESRLQQGTRIRVLFPAVAAGDNLGRETEVPKTSLAPEIPRPILSILVVDDEEMIREVAHDLLHELEYPVLLAVDGEDALRVFSQHRETIGCIILDLSMPRMDGLSAVKELKKIDPDVRIILSSGYNEQAALQRYSNIGLAGFLQKPYTMEGLRTILAMTLAGNGSGAHRST